MPNEIDQLLRQLKRSSWWLDQSSAAEALGERKDPRALDTLIKALSPTENSHPVVRRESAKALGKIGETRATAALVAALRDEEPQVRTAALWALGSIGDEEAVEPIMRGLEDTLEFYEVATALGDLQVEPALDALIGLLDRPDRHGARPCPHVIKCLGSYRHGKAVSALADLARSRDPRTRACAASALGDSGSKDAIQPLLAIVEDENPGVRSAAARALGKLRDPRTAGRMSRQLANEHHPGAILAIVQALAEMLASHTTLDLDYAPVAGALEKAYSLRSETRDYEDYRTLIRIPGPAADILAGACQGRFADVLYEGIRAENGRQVRFEKPLESATRLMKALVSILRSNAREVSGGVLRNVAELEDLVQMELHDIDGGTLATEVKADCARPRRLARRELRRRWLADLLRGLLPSSRRTGGR